jgi:hypothetical protein
MGTDQHPVIGADAGHTEDPFEMSFGPPGQRELFPDLVTHKKGGGQPASG